MTDTYKILGQGSNFLRIDAPENGSTIVSNLRVVSTSNDSGADVANNFDVFFADKSSSLSYKTKVDHNFPKIYNFDQAFALSPYKQPISSAIQSDGKIIISGYFPELSSGYQIVRFNIDGTADFDTVIDNAAYSIAVQPDGKIIIAGYFTQVSGVNKSYLARLNSDGSLDESFSPVINGGIYTMTLLSNGKILIGGDFTEVGGIARPGYALINSDSTLDLSFVLSPRPTSTPQSVVQQSDGKIIIGGYFIDIEEQYLTTPLYRFNLDGTLDTSFPEIGGAIYSLAIQEDGKILIGGNGISINGTTVSTGSLIRLNSDGTLDENFISSLTPSGYVTSMAIQEDGKILVIGSYTFVNGFPRRQISRINSDGSTDKSFDHSLGPDPNISGAVGINSKIYIKENNEIFIIGDVQVFDDQYSSGIIKLVKKFFTDNEEDYIVKNRNFYDISDRTFNINGIVINNNMSLVVESETSNSFPITIQCYGIEEK
jgi:uncharacterized delta-60 repeat protein